MDTKKHLDDIFLKPLSAKPFQKICRELGILGHISLNNIDYIIVSFVKYFISVHHSILFLMVIMFCCCISLSSYIIYAHASILFFLVIVFFCCLRSYRFVHMLHFTCLEVCYFFIILFCSIYVSSSFLDVLAYFFLL